MRAVRARRRMKRNGVGHRIARCELPKCDKTLGTERRRGYFLLFTGEIDIYTHNKHKHANSTYKMSEFINKNKMADSPDIDTLEFG